MRIVEFLREVFDRHPVLLVGNILLLLVVNAAGVLSIFSLAPVVDAFLNPGLEGSSPITAQASSYLERIGLQATLSNFLIIFLGFQFLKNGLLILARYSMIRVKYAVMRDLIVESFRTFFSARWLFFTTKIQGSLINTFTREVGVVGNAFSATALFFANGIQVCFYMAVPLTISWQVTAASLVFALVLVVPFFLLGRMNYRLGQINTSTANHMNHIMHESLGAAKLILGFGNQTKSQRALEEAYDAHRTATTRSQTLALATPFGYEPLGLIVVVFALFMARSYDVPVAEMAVLLWALRHTMPSVAEIAKQRNSLSNFFPSYEQIRRLNDEAARLRHPRGEHRFAGLGRGIQVKNVTYAYPDQSETLSNISLEVETGTMVAFVGPSGSGKSTLIDLVMGFLAPSQGDILIDGRPLEEFDLQSFRDRVGYVPQDAPLFNTTIRENLHWAKDDATETELVNACKLANADSFIRDLPDGYETLVGDRGVRLSGGQAQRVALARAILRKPDLLILDEATSSLDTESERSIQEAVESIAEDTTILVIAHRLSTVVHADKIYVIDEGRIVEQGTYQELVGARGRFEHMTRLQAIEPTEVVE